MRGRRWTRRRFIAFMDRLVVALLDGDRVRAADIVTRETQSPFGLHMTIIAIATAATGVLRTLLNNQHGHEHEHFLAPQLGEESDPDSRFVMQVVAAAFNADWQMAADLTATFVKSIDATDPDSAQRIVYVLTALIDLLDNSLKAKVEEVANGADPDREA